MTANTIHAQKLPLNLIQTKKMNKYYIIQNLQIYQIERSKKIQMKVMSWSEIRFYQYFFFMKNLSDSLECRFTKMRNAISRQYSSTSRTVEDSKLFHYSSIVFMKCQ